MGKEDDEEDYDALIYKESQLRKAEAAAVAAEAAKYAIRRRIFQLMFLQLDVVLHQLRQSLLLLAVDHL
jgi:hypothetical protein